MTTSNRDALIELMLADELSADERHRLRDLMVSESDVESEAFDQLLLEPLLHDHFAADPDAFVRRVEAEFDDDRATSQFTEQVLLDWTSRRNRKRLIAWGAGLAVALVVLVSVANYLPRRAPALSADRILTAAGSVEITRVDGASRPADFGTLIHPGETIRTTGASSATIACTDETHIVLTRDASLTWPEKESNRIVLLSGLAQFIPAARVNDRSKTIVFATQHATIETRDAELLLATSDHQTDVIVRRGKASVIGPDGRSIQLTDGESGIATGESLELRRGHATPDSWSEDFEGGLPTGWQAVLVEKDLPTGSRRAAQTTRSQSNDGEECYQLWSHSDWQHGLAVVHADTCLNFVYRFKKADTVQVMTLIRSPFPDSPNLEVQILRPFDLPKAEQWWNVPADEWYVASIPLSRLTDPVSLRRPPVPSVVTAFNFRAQNDACRLAIDRVWIERGTSNVIEFEPYQPAN